MKLVGIKQEQVDAEALKAKGDSVLATRSQMYNNLLDGLYFKEQRGEVPVGTWKQAVIDMKAANPYPAGYVPPENSNG